MPPKLEGVRIIGSFGSKTSFAKTALWKGCSVCCETARFYMRGSSAGVTTAAKCGSCWKPGFFMLSMYRTRFSIPTAGRAKPPGLEVQQDFCGAINDAYARGVASAIYSPLGGGFLTDDSILGVDRHPLARPIDGTSETSRRRREMANILRVLARECGHTLAQMAFNFILAHKGVTTLVLGGFSSRGQLENCVRLGHEAVFVRGDETPRSDLAHQFLNLRRGIIKFVA